jgi:hypothetical protein
MYPIIEFLFCLLAFSHITLLATWPNIISGVSQFIVDAINAIVDIDMLPTSEYLSWRHATIITITFCKMFELFNRNVKTSFALGCPYIIFTVQSPQGRITYPEGFLAAPWTRSCYTC